MNAKTVETAEKHRAEEYAQSNKSALVITLAGNPNAGKTTLFNALTGLRQKVANYSGVTVERKEGVWKLNDGAARLIDLPGLYSLDAASLDEQIARDVLTGNLADLPMPDAIVAVVDATNLERNLYLVTQLLEYKIPLVIALTMSDTAAKQNLEIDVKKLSARLHAPTVAVTVSQNAGLAELGAKVAEAVKLGQQQIPFELVAGDEQSDNSKIFARYNFISDVFQEAVAPKSSEEANVSEKIDRVLTHKFFGLIILVGILLLVFQTIFSWANLPMHLLEAGFGEFDDFARASLPAGLLTDLIVDGVIAGVGGVLVFLPQILLLFLFISILEDTGYMARAAFLLDKLMSRVGLHGKAFLPLMSSFACAIPGIMATRTIENRRDRLATIMIAPFMSCSARLPVYALMIATFFAGQTIFGFISLGAVLMLAMYALGIVTAIVVAWILKKTILKSPPPSFVMELPPYRLPNARNVLQNMFNNGWQFLKRAGTVILAISIILWALTAFPRSSGSDVASPGISQNQIAPGVQEPLNNITTGDESGDGGSLPDEAQIAAAEKKVAAEKQGAALRNSYAGQLGRLIEPVIEPLGFDWKIGVALIASFAAREVLVSTLSIIYNTGKEENEESEGLMQAIRDAKRDDGTRVWTPLTAVTLMVFFVLAIQCMSTVAVVRRETNSWSWTIFMVIYMTGLAYAAAFLTYQGGRLLGFG